MPPIPADLWARFRRFEPHCNLTIERTGFRGHRRWQLKLQHVGRIVSAEGALVDAMERVAADAEGWGWHLSVRWTTRSSSRASLVQPLARRRLAVFDDPSESILECPTGLHIDAALR